MAFPNMLIDVGSFEQERLDFARRRAEQTKQFPGGLPSAGAPTPGGLLGSGGSRNIEVHPMFRNPEWAVQPGSAMPAYGGGGWTPGRAGVNMPGQMTPLGPPAAPGGAPGAPQGGGGGGGILGGLMGASGLYRGANTLYGGLTGGDILGDISGKTAGEWGKTGLQNLQNYFGWGTPTGADVAAGGIDAAVAGGAPSVFGPSATAQLGSAAVTGLGIGAAATPAAAAALGVPIGTALTPGMAAALSGPLGGGTAASMAAMGSGMGAAGAGAAGAAGAGAGGFGAGFAGAMGGLAPFGVAGLIAALGMQATKNKPTVGPSYGGSFQYGPRGVTEGLWGADNPSDIFEQGAYRAWAPEALTGALAGQDVGQLAGDITYFPSHGIADGAAQADPWSVNLGGQEDTRQWYGGPEAAMNAYLAANRARGNIGGFTPVGAGAYDAFADPRAQAEAGRLMAAPYNPAEEAYTNWQEAALNQAMGSPRLGQHMLAPPSGEPSQHGWDPYIDPQRPRLIGSPQRSSAQTYDGM